MLKKFIPALEWLPNYKRTDLSGDLSAGLIVAIMLIPQGMAYALLAGLPPVIGLYASTIPLLIYALFGTSKHLAVGPVAIVSLLVLTGVSTLAEPGSEEYIALVLLLMLMIGILQFLMGVLRLGFLVNFLSHAVISAFTSAAAIIIGLSQLKHLLGVKLEAGKDVFKLLTEAFMRASEINPITISIGIISILVLVYIKKLIPRIPGPLLVVVVSILVVYGFNLENFGVKIVGEVPSGLPGFSIPSLDFNAFLALIPIAVTISLIGFMESIAMAKAIAAKEKYKVVPNKELIGLGLANIGGSFFSAYPVTGGFSRSAVNYQSGARTPMASFITAFLIFLTLLFFTGMFYYLPNAVLAAIIMVAVYGLIDVKEAKHLFKVRSVDGWTWVITFVATLVIGIELGILVGVGFSLIVFIGRSAYPHVAELGFLSEEKVYRNIKRYPNAKVSSDVIIFRFDASLYFANMTFFEDKLSERILDKSKTRWVVLDFSGVNSIDAVALHSLKELIMTYREAKVEFLLAGVKGPVMDLMKKAGYPEEFYEKITYLSVDHALKDIGLH
ncbi:SulP family inorganic anion transporter [Anaerobacillus isosaccharinicus]|uniref:Sodium-independent anion transporter n=1 Tax=Anaerobacillus isosaccharinicus TaxID=1532552 RepID=A0A1S2MFA8_9BACI|nr:solute carrier family 26 protein [Anaerobacillus isosaccharinicus]MBA5585099.1 solute carrier family 26 protein [Anaerobacillus isosaccharinicus]QOY36557.1 solute carrier family 26 protein [Anaerobacillus isosaccharinicus]